MTNQDSTPPHLPSPTPPIALATGDTRTQVPGWTVLKLGGTSMASRQALDNAIAVVAEQAPAAGERSRRVALVPSALAGVTDQLTALVGASNARGPRTAAIAALRDRHLELLGLLADGAEERLATARLGLLLTRLDELLGRHPWRPADRVEILATGERLSTVLLWAALGSRGLPAQAVDAGELLAAEGPLDDARPDLEASRRRVAIRLGRSAPRRLVMPGFFARGSDGVLRLLGRGGSDTAAALLGAALGARRVEIWTDVAGVYPADPRQHDGLEPYEHLTYAAAEALAQAGAKVLHPDSVAPARHAGVPLWVRQSTDLEQPGTWIGAAS